MVVQVVVDLLKNTLNICKAQSVSLSDLPAFSTFPNDWTAAILKSYENFYRSDCLKLIKLNKPDFDKKALEAGIPSNFVCFSTAIKSIISTIDSASGSSFMAGSVKEITERVNIEVFN